VMTTTTDPPEAKKLRLSAGPCPDPVISGNHCPERVVSDDIVPSCGWSTSNPIRPDQVASDSIRPDAASSSDLQPTRLPAPEPAPSNFVLTSDTPPSSDNIKSALRVISSETKNKRDPNRVLQALSDLSRWAISQDRFFLNEFYDLSGIPRTLKFLLKDYNMADMVYLKYVGTIIGGCTYFGKNKVNLDIAEKMANTFIEKDGVVTMLLANEEYTGENNNYTKLRAVFSIWAALTNVVGRGQLNEDQVARVFDDAFATLALLNGADLHFSSRNIIVSRIRCDIFGTLGNLMIRSNNTTILVVNNFFNRMDVFQICIDVMKLRNGQWNYNERFWSKISYFFFKCYDRNVVSRNDINSSKLIVTFCIEYIKQAPDSAVVEAGVFRLLYKASKILGKQGMVQSNGLLSTLGHIADYGNDDVEERTKEEAKHFLKYLFV
jgi:hypothetical protein